MTALDLIKRLRAELATAKRLLRDMDYRDFDDHTLITQADAFCDGAVETTLGTQSALYIYDATSGDSVPVLPTETGARNAVTIIVRPKGDG